MSTLVSGGYTMPEKLHKDFQNNLLGREISDIGLALSSSMFGSGDSLTPVGNHSFTGVWPLQRPMNLSRRNSTSSVSSTNTARNRGIGMNLNSFTTIGNVIPEATTATNHNAISSMTHVDGFRGRAYSEGASSLSSDSSLQQQQQSVASSRYKTELCRPFEENGKCKYGDKCQFAHGKHELRHLVRHPKYKTELCRTFHTSGFCPYGPRCHFIHNQDDSANRGNVPMQAASGIAQPPAKGSPIAVPTPHISARNHFSRPSHLKSFYGVQQAPASPQEAMPLSPTSPTAGSAFNFSGIALAKMMAAHLKPDFDFQHPQENVFETTVNEDIHFDGLVTPPDSDRESVTGSPPEKQRLPIFRCLSQS